MEYKITKSVFIEFIQGLGKKNINRLIKHLKRFNYLISLKENWGLQKTRTMVVDFYNNKLGNSGIIKNQAAVQSIRQFLGHNYY